MSDHGGGHAPKAVASHGSGNDERNIANGLIGIFCAGVQTFVAAIVK